MLVVETVVRIRGESAAGKSIKAICRDLRLCRKVVRKAILAEEGAFSYRRVTQPFPKIGPVRERLEQLLTENEARSRRERSFKPRLRFATLEELNGWLEAECRRWARLHPDGFHEVEHAVTGTCLITFDRNRYSVMARAAKRKVQVRAYADKIVVRCAGEVVAEHARSFGRGRTIYDPWRYLPVLARKPGALRNGAPFQP